MQGPILKEIKHMHLMTRLFPNLYLSNVSVLSSHRHYTESISARQGEHAERPEC